MVRAHIKNILKPEVKISNDIYASRGFTGIHEDKIIT